MNLAFSLLLFLTILSHATSESPDTISQCSSDCNAHDSSAEEEQVSVVSILDSLRDSVREMANQHPILKFFRGIYKNETLDIDKIEQLFRRFIVHHGVFSLYFKDLNGIILPYDETLLSEASSKEETKTAKEKQGDTFRRFINKHTYEDREHYKFLLHDWQEMGLNEMFTPVDFLQFWFGDAMAASRQAAYQIIATDAKYGGAHDPMCRYVLIETVEMTGQHIFSLLSALYFKYKDAVESTENRELYELFYTGNTHASREMGDLYIDESDHAQFQNEFTTKKQSLWYMEGGKEIIEAIDVLWSGSYQFMVSEFDKQELWPDL